MGIHRVPLARHRLRKKSMEEQKLDKKTAAKASGGYEPEPGISLFCPECCEEEDITVLEKTPIGRSAISGDVWYEYTFRCNRCGTVNTWR